MNSSKLVKSLCIGVMMTSSFGVLAHGDVTPQAMDTSTITALGKEWKEQNPYRDVTGDLRKEILRIGASAYNQNCARCHGLEGISGGIAPDLRMLPSDFDGDEWYVYRVRNGAVRNGAVYMPKMADYLSQEALWSVRTWLESVSVEE
ncbi:MAG: cytochrome c-550 PedF [Gammaproteobacteria bacterium]|nr:cytochrome c-550 PedF [Gammaproteobacteria bacterium]